MRRIESVTKAYHSTRQKGLKKFENRTTTATIDTGEGAHVHGWGLYLQADEKENRRLYYDAFAGNYHLGSSYHVKAFGKEFIANPTDDSCMIDDWNSFNVYDFEYPDEYTDLSSAEELIVNMLLYGYSKNDIKEFCNELIENADEWGTPEILIHYTLSDIRDVVELVDVADFDCALIEPGEPEVLEDGTHSQYVSQYTVEIPDDMVFIDEYTNIPEWLSTLYVDEFRFTAKENEFGQMQTFNYNDIANEEYLNNYINKPNNFMDKEMFKNIQIKRRSLIKDLKEERKNTIKHYTLNYTGEAFYNMLSDELDGQEQASLWLSENGIDGMTYEGGRDGGCFVIYNCDKLKIVGEY